MLARTSTSSLIKQQFSHYLKNAVAVAIYIILKTLVATFLYDAKDIYPKLFHNNCNFIELGLQISKCIFHYSRTDSAKNITNIYFSQLSQRMPAEYARLDIIINISSERLSPFSTLVSNNSTAEKAVFTTLSSVHLSQIQLHTDCCCVDCKDCFVKHDDDLAMYRYDEIAGYAIRSCNAATCSLIIHSICPICIFPLMILAPAFTGIVLFALPFAINRT